MKAFETIILFSSLVGLEAIRKNLRTVMLNRPLMVILMASGLGMLRGQLAPVRGLTGYNASVSPGMEISVT